MRLGIFFSGILLLIFSFGLWSISNNRRDEQPRKTPASKPLHGQVSVTTSTPSWYAETDSNVWRTLAASRRTLTIKPAPAPTPEIPNITLSPDFWARNQSRSPDDEEDRIEELESEIEELKSELEAKRHYPPPRPTGTRMVTIKFDDGNRIRAHVPADNESGLIFFRDANGENRSAWIDR